MKNVLIISATLNTNYTLAKDIEKILLNLNVKVTTVSLEDYSLPLYTAKNSKIVNENGIEKIENLTKHLINNQGIIVCGPEYNGSIPPIITNAISWISTSTDYWRDGFLNKIALVATSSGGPGNKFLTSMKMQLEHLGAIVMPRFINISSSLPLKKDSAEKILKQFINLL